MFDRNGKFFKVVKEISISAVVVISLFIAMVLTADFIHWLRFKI